MVQSLTFECQKFSSMIVEQQESENLSEGLIKVCVFRDPDYFIVSLL